MQQARQRHISSLLTVEALDGVVRSLHMLLEVPMEEEYSQVDLANTPIRIHTVGVMFSMHHMHKGNGSASIALLYLAPLGIW